MHTWENKETVQICPFYFLSKFYSSQIFVCLTLITYWFSVHLLPLQSIHIIFEYFLLDLWLPILAALFSDTLFDVFVGHRHTAFTRQQTSKPVTFGSQTCLRHFYWFEGVTEIEWQMLSQHWSHIPMWERTASVAFICCYLDKSWIGGYLRSTVPKTTPQKTVLGWQWRKQPKFVGSLSSDLWF